MEELRKRIIEKATSLFQKFGPKSVTMDQVSEECGISKRTLYQLFTDKGELLKTCLEIINKSQHEYRSQLQQNSPNVIDFFIKATKQTIENTAKYNPNFFPELQKFFPEVAEYQNKVAEQVLYRDLAEVLNRGVQEEIFRKEVNTEIALLLLKGQIDLLYFSNLITHKKLSFSELFQTMIFLFLRGIATPKGLEVIAEYEA